MLKIDYIEERLDACNAFLSKELIRSDDYSTEYQVVADQFSAGIQLIRGKLQQTRFSDELIEGDSNDTITFMLNRIHLGDRFVNAMVILTMDSPTKYRVIFQELSEINVDYAGREYLS